MVDDFLVEQELVDFQVDYLTDFQCEDCNGLLGGRMGELECTNCGATYTEETTTIYQRREVN